MNGEHAEQERIFDTDEQKLIRLAKQTVEILATVIAHKDPAVVKQYLILHEDEDPSEDMIKANSTADLNGLNLHHEAITIGRLGPAVFDVLWRLEQEQ